MLRMQKKSLFLALLMCSALALPVQAYAQAEQEDDVVDAHGEQEIIVLGRSYRGEVIGESAVEVELGEEDIASYGASNIQELISQIAPLTRSSRGQGGGAAVLLVNGRRIASRREIFRMPPEAIAKVQVLPEEVALRYGYAADQRVINFILKQDFAAITTEVEYGQSGEGDPRTLELEGNYLKLTETGRWALNSEYTRSSRVLESARNIRGEDGTTNAGQFRTLEPQSDELILGGLYNASLTETLGLTLNAEHERAESEALQGKDGLSGLVQQRDSKSRTTHFGTTLEGVLSGWQWTWTANADWVRSHSLSFERGGGITESSASRQRTLGSDLNISGTLFSLPAGDVIMGLRTGVSDIAYDSDRDRSGVLTAQKLDRTEKVARANLDIPLLRNAGGLLQNLGSVSANINGSVQHLSDFGTLYSHGYGVTWKPSRNLTVNASMAHEKNAPGIGQLGAPLTTSYNVPIYDFARGETALVAVTSGGNPALNAEKRSDFKAGLAWEAPFVEGLTLLLDYYDNQSDGQIADLPLLTPEIEAAFPERVERDSDGRLIAIDQRSINFSQSSNQVLRYGFNFQKRFGESEGGGRGRGSPGRFGSGGRWNASIFHSIRLKDEVLVRPGLKLDLLDGDALSSNSGATRHLVELEGGWFFNGVGIRTSAKYESGRHVDGGLTGSDLDFSDLFMLDMRVFVRFDTNASLLERHPWLKGVRLRLKVENLFDARREVRDSNGQVPLSYQPGYIDPRGRFMEISLRKQF